MAPPPRAAAPRPHPDLAPARGPNRGRPRRSRRPRVRSLYLRFSGPVWRHVPAGGHPFDLSYILTATGRWNRAGEYGCLYVALDAETARAEYTKYRARAGDAGGRGSREVVRFEVEVEPVLDLTDPAVRKRLGVAEPVLTGDDDGDLEACRRIADWARAHDHAALRAPSAAGEGLVLAIWPDASSKQLVLHHRIRRQRV